MNLIGYLFSKLLILGNQAYEKSSVEEIFIYKNKFKDRVTRLLG